MRVNLHDQYQYQYQYQYQSRQSYQHHLVKQDELLVVADNIGKFAPLSLATTELRSDCGITVIRSINATITLMYARTCNNHLIIYILRIYIILVPRNARMCTHARTIA
jgi:hypothetical protein